jgi:hypothetical protein
MNRGNDKPADGVQGEDWPPMNRGNDKPADGVQGEECRR